MEFKDVMKLVIAMEEHPHIILPNDAVKNKVSFIAEDGAVFSISKADLKSSMKNYPPNRECIVLAEKALNGDKEPLADYINGINDTEDEPTEEDDSEEEDGEFDENQYALSAIATSGASTVDKLIENVDPIDKYTKDLLVRMSLMSPSALDGWRNDSIYGRLLVAVLNNEGPKGEWLKIVLDSLKQR